jgi:hypothetical protein
LDRSVRVLWKFERHVRIFERKKQKVPQIWKTHSNLKGVPTVAEFSISGILSRIAKSQLQYLTYIGSECIGWIWANSSFWSRIERQLHVCWTQGLCSRHLPADSRECECEWIWEIC